MLSTRWIGLLLAFCCLLGCGSSTGEDQLPGVEIEVLSPPASTGEQAFDEPPVLITYETPRYPEDAREAGLEGTVTVRLTVGEDGRVIEASIVESSDPAFEGSALEAASRCGFRPAKLGGDPKRVQVIIPYQFRLGS